MQTQPTGEHTILVVDDDDLFLQYSKRVLSNAGMLVDIAGDGLQALHGRHRMPAALEKNRQYSTGNYGDGRGRRVHRR